MQSSYVVSFGELVDIALQMLGRHLVIDAVIAPFQQRPEGFDAVRVCLSLYILADRMLDALMLVASPRKSPVAAIVVGVDG